jgi:hypothetical protein
MRGMREDGDSIRRGERMTDLDHGLLYAGHMPHLFGTEYSIAKPIGGPVPNRFPAADPRSKRGKSQEVRRTRAPETYHRVHPVTQIGDLFGWGRVVEIGTEDSRGR